MTDLVRSGLASRATSYKAMAAQNGFDAALGGGTGGTGAAAGLVQSRATRSEVVGRSGAESRRGVGTAQREASR